MKTASGFTVAFCGLLFGCDVNTKQAMHENAHHVEPHSAEERMPATITNDNVAFQALVDAFWGRHLADMPLVANVLGDMSHTDDLDHMSEDAFAQRRDRFDSVIREVKKIDRDALSPAHQTNYDIFNWILINERRALDLPTRFFTFNTVASWVLALPRVFAATPFSTREDYDGYAARVSEVGRFIDETIALSRRGIATGYVHPCESLRGYANGVLALIPATPEDSFAYAPVAVIPDHLAAIAADVQAQLTSIIENTVTPAYERYHDFLTNEYLPACRDTYGLGALPDGDVSYAHAVRYYSTTPDISPDDVHALGLAEVDRIQTEMHALMSDVSFDGSLSEFFEFMRSNPSFFAKTEEEYLKQVAMIAKKIDAQLPRFFSLLPRNRFAMRQIPAAIASKSAIGFYQPGSLENGIPGQYFVNLDDLSSKSLNALPALGLHEASPGHHLQMSIQQEQGDLPLFRRTYFFNAYSEGWGLYAEFLGEEMGIYENPYERFESLNFEVWRACRLVVDTGIHAKGWSRAKAIDYMIENTSLGRENIINEVDRYITMPGQAISYKIGELKIKEIRKKAENELGERFSLRDFHTHLLVGGPMPIEVLEIRMNEWIRMQR